MSSDNSPSPLHRSSRTYYHQDLTRRCSCTNGRYTVRFEPIFCRHRNLGRWNEPRVNQEPYRTELASLGGNKLEIGVKYRSMGLRRQRDSAIIFLNTQARTDLLQHSCMLSQLSEAFCDASRLPLAISRRHYSSNANSAQPRHRLCATCRSVTRRNIASWSKLRDNQALAYSASDGWKSLEI